MTADKDQLGRWGEKQAVRFLKKHGYRVLGRNVASGVGEIDVVARDGDEVVFVEVKTRTDEDFGGPLLAVDRAKRRKLVQLARTWLARHRLDEVACRFDVVGVTFLDEKKHPDIELVKNAFTLRDV
ncbi:MAG TPA: YraN family protein [Planctomycetota bacterium]|nr:YraN family protein [Planctomycetota bacterium]